jgi:TolB protein
MAPIAARPRLLGRLAPAVVAALLLAGCGGDDDDGTGGSSGSDEVIVYEASVEGVTNVHAIDAQTGATQQLTSGASYDGAPAWSPDRQRVIFSSDRNAGRRVADVFTMAPDGSDVRALTATPDEAEWYPKYSPDGEQVAYVLRRGEEYFLGLMDADGSNQRTITGGYQFVEFPAWRRDGREIYFAAIGDGTDGPDVLAVNLETEEVRAVISRPGADVCPHFTIDGKYMTYAGIADGESEPDIFRHDLSSDDSTGADDVRLTDNGARDDYANPSPDGTRFVFLSFRSGDPDLWLMDADGSNERPLTETPAIRENVPDW